MTSKSPMIGSYRKKEGAPPGMSKNDDGSLNIEDAPDIVDKREQQETPADSLAEGIEEELTNSVPAGDRVVTKTKTYKEILSENDIAEATAHIIVDNMLEQGFYQTRVSITKTISVTFKTRSQEDFRNYLRALERYNPRFVTDQNDLQLRYFLAASLIEYKGTTFSHLEPTADNVEERRKLLDDRLDWIDRQPERLIALLATKLAKFDREIEVVLSEGVIENF